MTCGNEGPRQLWLVTVKAGEWTTPACCQLEAWDSVFGEWTEADFVERLGLIAQAQPVEATEDQSIPIHAVGLAMRYGLDAVAEAADQAGMSRGLPSVKHIYEGRGDWWRVGGST